MITQHGVSVTLNKVEFADNKTRIYMSIENKSKDKFSFYSFNTKITQNSKQYEEESNYYAGYEEIKSDILPGVKEEGIIAFKNIDQANFKLLCEGNSDNYSLDFADFVFDVEVK